MRLFTAIELDADVRRALRRTVEELRPRLALRWVRPENQHLTLKFIGDWPEEVCDDVVKVLGEVRSGAIPLTVAGLGVLPNLRSPRVFWAGVRHGDDLPELAGKIDDALASLGIERERRAYRPHVTLGRMKGRIRAVELQQAFDAHDREFGSWVADRFVLFASDLRPTGAVYRKVAEFELRDV